MSVSSQNTAGRVSRDVPVRRYSGVAITLHWLITLLIAVNLALVWLSFLWPDAWIRPVIDTHKSIGITVLGLVAMRLLWRWTHRPPPLPADHKPWERRVAHIAHALLYVLILAMPLSGWMHDSAWKLGPTHPDRLFWLLPLPRIAPIMDMAPGPKEQFHSTMFAIHVYLAYVFCALFVLHVAGALKHQWLDRTPELQRMLPGRS